MTTFLLIIFKRGALVTMPCSLNELLLVFGLAISFYWLVVGVLLESKARPSLYWALQNKKLCKGPNG